MLDYFFAVAGQVVTLFLMMGVGFFLAKKAKLSAVGQSQITYLLLYVVAACIIIESFQTERTPEMMRDVGLAALVMVAIYLVYAVAVLPLFRRQSDDTRTTLQFGVVYANIGFMGLPLVEAILGPEALIFAAVSFVVFSVFCWIHGVIVMGGRKEASLKKAFLNPGVIALAIGLPLFLTNLRLPVVVNTAISYMADLNTPLAMVVIGAQMASTNIPSTFRRPILYGSAALKLLAVPALTAALLFPLLSVSPLMYATIVLLSATPTAGITGMFSLQFNRDATTAAQSITLSTLLSVLTLPLWAVVIDMIVTGQYAFIWTF